MRAFTFLANHLDADVLAHFRPYSVTTNQNFAADFEALFSPQIYSRLILGMSQICLVK